MSFFAAYWFEEPRKPEEGEHLATSRGWNLFSLHVEHLPKTYPSADHLVQRGWLAAGDLPALEVELTRFLRKPPPGLEVIGRRLLQAVRDRPADCLGMIVTDGEPGGDGDGHGDEL